MLDQACSLKMAGYWPRSKKEKDLATEYLAVLTSGLVNNTACMTCFVFHIHGIFARECDLLIFREFYFSVFGVLLIVIIYVY